MFYTHSVINENWRSERLSNLLDKMVSVMNFNEYTKIEGVDDHEGQLTVTWNEKHHPISESIIALCWEELGELAGNVEHIIQENS